MWVTGVKTSGTDGVSPTGASLAGNPVVGRSITIDASGNFWIGFNTVSSPQVLKLPPNLSGNGNTYSAQGLATSAYPNVVADGNGNIWYTNALSGFINSIYEMNSSGTYVGSRSFGSGSQLKGIGFDPSENVWVSDISNNELWEIGNNLSNSTTQSFACGCTPQRPASDSTGNMWIGGTGLVKMIPGGSYTTLQAAAFGGAGGLSTITTAPVIDGAGNAWVLNDYWVNSLSEFSNSGTALTPAHGYQSSTFLFPNALAVDGSGNVWVYNGGAQDGYPYQSFTVFVGGGVPTVTRSRWR